MIRRLVPAVLAVVLFAAGLYAPPASAENRDLLWRVVQACVLSHSLTGTAFPCLAVDTTHGIERGYAVVRAPKDKTRIVIVPTVYTPGIEASRLRGPDAPNYFQDAWASRRFVLAGLPLTPSRGDLAMAVNSVSGRSQDQLHVHLACIRPDVKQTILAQRRKIRADRWTAIKVLPSLLRYEARLVAGDDLRGINPFDQAAQALRIEPTDMNGVTIVVLAAEAEPSLRAPAGFILMTRRKRNEDDAPHGEGLLDPSCSAFHGSSG